MLEEDVRAATAAHSNELLQELTYEIRDTQPEKAPLIEEFVGGGETLVEDELRTLLTQKGHVGAKKP